MNNTSELSLREQISNLKSELAALENKLISSFPNLIKLPDRDYSVSETHITVAQYEHFCSSTNRKMPKQPDPIHPNNPVVNVTLDDARAYCKWLSKELNCTIRLPTEDEYEHFCGDHQEGTEETAVFLQDNITQVATKKPNKFGLYDTLGLAWHWTDSNYE